MMKGEFEKRLHVLTSFATRYTLNDEEWIKVNEIVGQIQRINEKNISEVLSDARTEFPRLTPQIPMSMITVNDYIHNELEPWVEKWFGSKERES